MHVTGVLLNGCYPCLMTNAMNEKKLLLTVPFHYRNAIAWWLLSQAWTPIHIKDSMSKVCFCMSAQKFFPGFLIIFDIDTYNRQKIINSMIVFWQVWTETSGPYRPFQVPFFSFSVSGQVVGIFISFRTFGLSLLFAMLIQHRLFFF